MNANLNLSTSAQTSSNSTMEKVLRATPSLFTTTLLILGLLLFCALATGCNITSPDESTSSSTNPAKVELVEYNGTFFKMMIPRGWRVDAGANIGGDCAAMYVIVTDPSNPMRKIFYMNKSALFPRSEMQRQMDLHYYQTGGMLINIPVTVDPATPSNFMSKLHLMIDAASRYPGFFVPRDTPQWDTLNIVSTIYQPAVWSSLLGPTELMRGVFLKDGKVGQGLFIATVVPIGPDMGMAGAGNGCAYAFGGIMAPKGEFMQMQEALALSAASLTFNDTYMYTCIGLKQADIQQRQQDITRTLAETSEIMNESWRSRNRSEDVSAEKWSDAMRGVERLYDPSSGDVYEFENGFYDTYKNNSSDYKLTGLQPIPDDAYDIWTSAARDGYQYIR